MMRLRPFPPVRAERPDHLILGIERVILANLIEMHRMTWEDDGKEPDNENIFRMVCTTRTGTIPAFIYRWCLCSDWADGFE